ncbi:lutropin-choriogonadotropic hormone receptor isoform X2 [Nerophis ophidion]|uniref:lutropin-choriogonadotropic hormone receptor isoform X2 n=1 Tax=Nerophis ophidion TaxID=159077 RepID=UPI002ADF1E23|nr:lutropin-choriogonadotropic hormone receptor isoform X2 [Nerophis ophidion]
MTSQVLGVMVTLFGVLNVPSNEAFRCPEICCCTAFSFQCSNFTQLTKNRTSFGSILEVRYLDLKEVPPHAFSGLSGIKKILVSYSKHITQIRTRAFFFIRDLNEMRIYNTGLMHLPDLSTISFVGIVFFLSIEDNLAITSVPANSFCGISKMILDINMVSCGIKEVNPFAFNGTNLRRLDLSHNRSLRKLPGDAFRGATGPIYLDVSSTALSLLPQTGLQQVKQLRATSAFALKRLPPLDTLAKMEKANITYPSHCCAFNSRYIKRREEAKKKPLSPFCKKIQRLLKDSKVYHRHPELHDFCPTYPDFQCMPQPDAFNPCEDLLGPNLGRFTWTIAIFTVSGNLSVLTHLLLARRKLTISQFLICNLALADLCMGFYLMLIAFKDCDSRQEYYNYATDWQTGPWCGVAGFLTMFSCELSVYTLTVIGVERCYTIVNALDLNKRLCMHQVASTMVAGWVFSLLVALLPLFGVSSYSKVSICLPMDIDTWASQAYVVIVLSLNVLAFLLVCCCYGCIYRSVCKPKPVHRSSDTKLAKRMAVLIFTDFLCKAPISFFAISASVRMPLITVSHAKIVLVIFHPINSFCNPFLYTIFTRGFRKETGRLLHRCRGALTVFKSHRPTLRIDQRANIATKPESKV